MKRWLVPCWLMLFSLANGWRVLLALRQWQELPDLATTMQPGFVIVAAGAWAIVFAVLAVEWLFGKRFPTPSPSAPRQVHFRDPLPLLAMLLYQTHQWLDVALFARSQAAFDTLGYRALLTALAIGVTALLLWLSKGKRVSG